MKELKFKGRLTLLLVACLWIYLLFFIPTFDFDESLYRRVVDSMKSSHDPWNLSWDGDPLYHKPPLFYWLIWISSFLLDGAHAPVSSLAARLPSVLSTFGVLIILFFGVDYVMGEKEKSGRNWIPVFAFCAGTFPLLTSAGVVFDPLQTLMLMPALLIPTHFFYKEEPIKLYEWILWTLSLFLSCAVKGLNGIIIPSFAFALHLLFKIKDWGFASIFKIGLKYLAFAMIPASILIAAFYYLLDQKIGSAFTHEFLWVQHFQRSQNAMEDHAGSLLYHPLILFLGGGFLTPLFIYSWHRTKPSLIKFGFPLTFTLSFVLAFSFSATKLPHYTWPAWPAIALFLGMIGKFKNQETSSSPELSRQVGFLASIPVFLLGVSLLLLATTPEILIQAIPKTSQLQSLLNYFPGFSWLERGSFYLGALCCFIFQIKRRTITRSAETTALFAVISSLSLMLGISPLAKDLILKPFDEISVSLRALHPKKEECIRYSGALSPSLSIALGPELLHNRCYPWLMKYLIAPEWRLNECRENKMPVVAKSSYLYLCVKP